MEDKLSEALEKLRIRKKIIDTESDLSGECNAILELDHRIALLLADIRSLKNAAEEQGDFIKHICDKLEPDDKILKTTSQIFELITQLIKLNRLCKRIDSIGAFEYSGGPLDQSNRRPSLMAIDSGESCSGESNELASQMISEIVEGYEATYKPLESILSNRPDLPYHSYAVKVRRVKATLLGRTSNIQ